VPDSTEQPRGLTEVQRVSAGMIGRGQPYAAITKLLGPSSKTLQRWRKIAAFEAEVQRVQVSSEKPEPRGVLLDALSAHRGDGADWPTRVKAAMALAAMPDEPDNGPAHDGPTMVIYEPPPA
jgi:hypothetical protein